VWPIGAYGCWQVAGQAGNGAAPGGRGATGHSTPEVVVKLRQEIGSLPLGESKVQEGGTPLAYRDQG